MRKGRSLNIVLFLFNAAILTLYIINCDIISSLFLKLLYLALFSCLLAIFTIKFPGKIFQCLQGIQITLLSVILFFLVFEFFARLFPGLIPLQIDNYLVASDIDKTRTEMVEYLDESPFVKFKPDTIIKSQGYRGNKQQFVYEWKTDQWGFKNSGSVLDKEEVDIVALGDSFTEGMGVATEKTWPSRLTTSGYATYNLGVQGYAPIQLEGSLRKYGLRLKPKYIVIGYFENSFIREKAFFNKDKAIGDKQFTGGIQSIVNVELGGQVRPQAKYVASAVYLLARSIVFDLLYTPKISHDIEIKKSPYRAYKNEILAIGNQTSMIKEIKKESKAWKNTLFAFDNIITMAKEINAKVILLYLPQRGEIYYKAATGKSLPEPYFGRVEAYLLKKYAKENNIVFLDTSERLIKYVDNLPEDTLALEFPYLENDAHMSNKGHELVAGQIVDYLKTQNSL